jgi:putative tricarboxylic transport membrane protein
VEILLEMSLHLYTMIGVIIGIIFGATPGLTATMGVGLTIPLTFYMPEEYALALLLGIYVGGIAGGSITAILIGIPGSPASCVTVFDGHPMCKQGMPGKALGLSAFASFVGGIVSCVLLITIAPNLAKIALKFGPPEYFAVALFGLTIIANISGKSLAKGLIAGIVGVLLSTIGIDPITGVNRFTLDNIALGGGISILPALIGVYAFPELLSELKELKNKVIKINVKLKLREMVPSFKEIKDNLGNLVISSLIGTVVGIIPGTGSNIASFLAYDTQKRRSKHPEEFGNGSTEGVIASESANNAITGGALVPLLTLGIPGDSVTAMLMGALMIHGISTGPILFQQGIETVKAIYVSLMMANLFMLIIYVAGIRFFIRILHIPKHLLIPTLFVLCVVGAYGLQNSIFDVWIMFFLGILAYIFTYFSFPTIPIVLGVILGPIMETGLRQSLIMSQGSLSIFCRPYTAVFLGLALLSIVVAVINQQKAKKSGSSGVSL